MPGASRIVVGASPANIPSTWISEPGWLELIGSVAGMPCVIGRVFCGGHWRSRSCGSRAGPFRAGGGRRGGGHALRHRAGLLRGALAVALLWLAADPFAAERDRMVREQIEARGILDADVLRVLRDTPRHRFVPALLRAHACDDTPLPIGHGAAISQPFIEALMTELLEPGRGHSVLEIGTGSGYQAAVLA